MPKIGNIEDKGKKGLDIPKLPWLKKAIGAGAIEKLTILDDGSIEFKTIGNTHPAGLCGKIMD